MKNKILLFLIFTISFFSSVFLFGSFYYKYGISIEQIIFLLSFPMTGLDDAVSKIIFVDTLIYIVIPSFILSLFITFLPNIFSFLKNNSLITKLANDIKNHNIALRISISICFLIVSLNILENKFQVFNYLYSYFFKEYSNFYEQNYITPNVSKLNKPRNLIIIFAESMESTYSSKNIPSNILMQNRGGDIIGNSISKEYSPFDELIPNLSRFASDWINFSNTDVVGGIIQNPGSSVTIAGLISYLCGIPLNLPKGGVQSRKKTYLENVICIGEVLSSYGYNQAAIQGADSIFSGHNSFFAKQNIKMLDVNYFKQNGFISKNYTKNWGMEDAKVFAGAKNYLSSYKENIPFALYISTLDTHFPNGYVDKDFCSDLEFGYSSAIKCSDRIISDFIAWVKKQDFYKNTTIIILGDHLSMQQNFFPDNAKRAIFNVFINPKFSKEASKELIKNRLISHFDITPLILDSIGFKVESFGLGRNPLYKKTLLEEYEDFNDLIMQPSKTYESFWQEKSNKEK